MFALLYFLFSLTALLTATYTDLKERIVSDKISYGLVVFGILLHGAESIYIGNFNPLIVSAGVCIATFIVGYLLWKIGLWAGGDVKLFAGIGAMLPYNPAIVGNTFGIELLKANSLPLFPVSLFFFSVFAMLPYGMFLAIMALRKKPEKLKKILLETKKTALRLLELSIATIGFTGVLAHFNVNQIVVLPILLLLGIMPKKARIMAILLAAFFALSWGPMEFIIGTVEFFGVLFVFFSIIRFGIESRGLLNSEKKISELKDGDIVAETILEQNGTVLRHCSISIAKVFNCLKTNNLMAIKTMLSPKGKVLCSELHAGGVTIEEIAQLKKFVKKGLLEDSIEIKQSVAFVPAVLIAFFLLNILGDLVWNIFLK